MTYHRYTGGQFNSRDYWYRAYQEATKDTENPPEFDDFLDKVAEEVENDIKAYNQQYKKGKLRSRNKMPITFQEDGLIVDYASDAVPESYIKDAPARAWNYFFSSGAPSSTGGEQ